MITHDEDTVMTRTVRYSVDLPDTSKATAEVRGSVVSVNAVGVSISTDVEHLPALVALLTTVSAALVAVAEVAEEPGPVDDPDDGGDNEGPGDGDSGLPEPVGGDDDE